MPTTPPRKPNTKMKVAAKKAAAKKPAAPASLGRRVSRHEDALPEVKSLTQELELERPSPAKATPARTASNGSPTSEPMGAPSRGYIRNRSSASSRPRPCSRAP